MNELARAWANLKYISIGYKSDRGKVAKAYLDSCTVEKHNNNARLEKANYYTP